MSIPAPVLEALERLFLYNSGPISAANPHGFGNYGNITEIPRCLTDMATVAQWISETGGLPGPQGDQGDPGLKGADGRELELQKGLTHLQWRLTGDAEWIDLIPIADLKGERGDTGPKGDAFTVDATGLFAARSAYDAELEGFSFLATDLGEIYFREGAASGSWSLGVPFGKGEQGPEGPKGDTGAKGDTGDVGPKGDTGAPGSDATVSAGTGIEVASGQVSLSAASQQSLARADSAVQPSALNDAVSGKADTSDVATALEGKADLVDGKVPESQLPSIAPDWATKVQAEAGTATDVAMNPLRVAEAIGAFVGASVEVFDSSTTFTQDPDDYAYLLEGWGGGGAGGGGKSDMGGGGGGAYGNAIILADELPASFPIGVGAGGQTAGADGGTTFFNNEATFRVFGGKGGVSARGGAGGGGEDGGYYISLTGQTVNPVGGYCSGGGAGGSSSNSSTNGASCVMGGAGGGTARGPTLGGSSMNGGNGGDGASGNSGASSIAGYGSVPGGGGGGANAAAGFGKGGNGRIRVIRLKRGPKS